MVVIFTVGRDSQRQEFTGRKGAAVSVLLPPLPVPMCLHATCFATSSGIKELLI